MRGAADGCNRPLRQKLDGPETQAALEREFAEEPSVRSLSSDG